MFCSLMVCNCTDLLNITSLFCVFVSDVIVSLWPGPPSTHRFIYGSFGDFKVPAFLVITFLLVLFIRCRSGCVRAVGVCWSHHCCLTVAASCMQAKSRSVWRVDPRQLYVRCAFPTLCGTWWLNWPVLALEHSWACAPLGQSLMAGESSSQFMSLMQNNLPNTTLDQQLVRTYKGELPSIKRVSNTCYAALGWTSKCLASADDLHLINQDVP